MQSGPIAINEMPVCPFIYLYVCQTPELWQNERNIARIITPELELLVFWYQEWLVGDGHVPEILGQTDPVGAKTPIFNRFLLVAPQP